MTSPQPARNPTAATPLRYDLDLAKLADEELAVLAQECSFRPAANELVLRHHPRLSRLIAHQARQTTLTAADVQDAQQNAFFALLEAIAHYNTFEMVKLAGCSFRTYARLVTTRRFCNFVKHIRRQQKRYPCAARLDGNAAAEPGQDVWDPPAPPRAGPRRSDPASAAVRQATLGRLLQALERLEPKLRELGHALAAGEKLRQIAVKWGISYDVVKRQRRKLLAQLRTELGQCADD
jgi:RNA polymerase sigma factor (sigma-70 family)